MVMEWFDLTQRKTFKTEVDRKLTIFQPEVLPARQRPVDSVEGYT